MSPAPTSHSTIYLRKPHHTKLGRASLNRCVVKTAPCSRGLAVVLDQALRSGAIPFQIDFQWQGDALMIHLDLTRLGPRRDFELLRELRLIPAVKSAEFECYERQ